MKRLLLIALASLSIHAIAQTNTFPSSGNVGIGTTNPQAKLDVNNSVRISPYGEGTVGTGYMNTGTELKLMNGDIYNSGGSSVTKISFGGMFNPTGSTPEDRIYNSILWASGKLKIQNNQQDKIIIGGGDEWGQQNVSINPQGGNVGIGTVNPQAKLDVNNSVRISPYGEGTVGIGYLNTGTELKLMNGDIYNSGGSSVTRISFGGMFNPTGSTPEDRIYNSILWASGKLKIQNNQQDKIVIGGGDEWGQQNVLINPQGGNLGIGTTIPDQKLTVKGKIHAEEIIVDLNVPVADYVFKSNYKLMPLHQVEQFVKKNSHLPEIPSASEITKNGLSMGEMQNKLLQKVEELTLYAIQQNKEIVEQRKDRKELEVKLAKQESQYNAVLEKVEMLTKQIEKR